MKITKTLYLKNRKEWRSWLEKNHDKEKEIWLIYYKKHTNKPRIPYEDAVEEALCFGWIDSTVKKINKEKYAQRFTPRNKNSIWSELNKKRVKKMIKQGKMTKIGLVKFKNLSNKNQKNLELTDSLIIPKDLKSALQKNKIAWKNFQALAPSYKKLYIYSILTTKQASTRKRRIEKAIQSAKQNKKYPM